MYVLCCGYAYYGLTICGIVHFLGVVDIEIFVGSTLGAGVYFAGELAAWFLCGAVLSVATLGYTPLFTLVGLYVLRCEFSSC